VNLILFEPAEIQQPLPRTDRRAVHLLEVLRRTPDQSFDAGLVNGPRGKGTLDAITNESLILSFAWQDGCPVATPITLIVGLPRPQTARDILREATTLGVAAIHFVRTAKGEPSYAQSTLWTSGEWRRHLITGAEQAFDTRIPNVTWTNTLTALLPTLDAESTRIALDNYEAAARFGDHTMTTETRIVVAIGAERGWSGDDRSVLRQHDFSMLHLGRRVLRTETATIAALAIIRSKLGLI
jgi:16S rRNA (uracil1498-N3)-methyltransferase